jgi:Icc-related predicted phosphoesterase
MKFYYASDIHGSETCWRKFINAATFYHAEVIVMGGDITGKGVVPIVEGLDGGGWTAEYKGRTYELSTEDDVRSLESRITFTGMYAHRCTQAEYEQLAAATDRDAVFESIMIDTFQKWLALGEERLAKAGIDCWVMPGNDDAWAIDAAFTDGGRVRNCDRQVVDLGDGYSMLSLGYANPTPWDSPREVTEERLAEMIEELVPQVPSMDRAIFNLHVPPYNSELDVAPQLDDEMRIVSAGGEMSLGPVGSVAVREAIERYQPLLAVHGHIHESRNAKKIGRTLCVNPGSSYSLGQLDGVIIDLKRDRVRRHQFVIG